MTPLDDLFRNNSAWARQMCRRDPDYFRTLAQQQAPRYLWIGCSDSRVPANTILGLEPGEVFVHRNVANLIKLRDENCLSVMQFAIETLEVDHIIVCGHYGCGGVRAALSGLRAGLVGKWLDSIHEVARQHAPLLAAQECESSRLKRLCELNVIEQVVTACQAEAVRHAWLRGRQLHIHGWIYGLEDGLLRDLGMRVSAPDELAVSYRDALAAIARETAERRHAP